MYTYLQINPLSRAAAGPVTVARVSERIEIDDIAIKLVADAGLTPGRSATVTSTGTDAVHVHTPSGDYSIPAKVADQLYVTVG